MKTTKLISITSLALQIFAVMLVTKGLFLVRESLLEQTGPNPLDGSETWFEPKSKVILLVIDSLRFNFLYYNKTLEGHDLSTTQNKFAKLNELAEKNPENFVFMKIFADAPTITIQKVTTMVTGYIPPYAELIDFIIRKPVKKDNIITKMHKANKNLVQLGDALWPFLFPNQFTESYPAEALVVTDFDSVDTAIERNIYSVVERNDFDFVVAHGIGVDHYGHLNRTSEPGFAAKLTQFDNMVTRIIDIMDNNTVLMVTGDHGMYKDGGHGGSTDLETDTALAAYTKKGFRKYKEQGLDDIMKAYKDPSSYVNQADMASTLATLLGVSIPYTNIGQIIDDLYPNDDNMTSNDFIIQIVKDNYMNMLQIEEYISSVQQRTHKFPLDSFSKLQSNFNQATEDFKKFNVSSTQSPVQEEELRTQGAKLIKKLQGISYEVYIMTKVSNSNGYLLMLMGSLLGLGSFVFSLLMIQRLNFCIKSEEVLFSWNDQADFLSILKYVGFEIKTNRILQLMTILIFIVCIRFELEFFESLSLFVFSIVLAAIYRLIKVNFTLSGKVNQYSLMDDDSTSSSPSLKQLPKSAWSIGSLIDKFGVILIIAVSIYNRNSIQTLVDEDLTLQYLMFALLALMFVKLLTLKDSASNKLWLIKQLVLLALVVGVLRHFDFFLHKKMILRSVLAPVFTSSITKIYIPLLIFAQRVYVKIQHFNQEENKQPLTRILLLISLFLICINYIIPLYLKDAYLPCKIVIPLVVYGLLTLTYVVALWKQCRRSPSSESNSDKDNFYNSNYLCLLMFVFLLAGYGAIGAFVLLYLAQQSINNYFAELNPESISYPFLSAALATYGFFCTGHSHLLHFLQFPQAYLGFYKFNFFTSGFLLSTNTFCTYFMCMMFLMDMTRYLYYKKETQIHNEVKEVNLKMHEDKAKTYKSILWLRNVFVFGTILSLSFAVDSYNSIKFYDRVDFLSDFSPKYIIDTTGYVTLGICLTVFS